MRQRALTALLGLLLVGGALADEQCAHGTLDPESGCCKCDSQWPDAGQEGWTGKNCTVPVYGVAEGAEAKGSLAAGEWACYALKFPWTRPDDQWHYLTVWLARTSEQGDPDLFGIFSGGARGLVQPNTTAKGYDFSETSSAAHARVVKKVKRADFGEGRDYEGALLCVRAYGASAGTSFTLKATLDRCPASFDPDGAHVLCGTRSDAPDAERRYSECTPAGECVCTGAWAKPVPEVVPGLGFEDCTASVTHVDSTQFDETHTFQADQQLVGPDQWRFYQFKVHQTDYQVVVDVAGEDAKGYLDAYLKYGAPPGWGPHEYDLRPDWNAALKDKALEVVLDPTKPQFRTGTWFVGVVGDHSPANFTLTISKFDCPLNCSGHGECIHGGEATDRKCQCKEGYGGDDCSKATAQLAFGTPVEHGLRSFEYDYYSLPPPTEGMKRGSVEVVVEATYFSDGYSRHMDIFPAILLAPSPDGAFPTASSYAHKLLLDKQNTTRTLAICPSQLAQGDWKLAVYNPMRVNSVGYTLTIRKEGRCLNNCTGEDHGRCNEDGVCECAANWAGGDCSVSPTAACLAGSRRAVPRSDQHGTCWQECSCNSEGKECSFKEECADFTCDAAPEGQLPLRRKAGELLCVQDQCVKDAWVQTHDYVCLRNCTCPADGGPCTLDADCGTAKVAIGGRHGVSGGAVFFWVLFSLLLGAAACLGYIHYLGVPAWLPVRARGFGGLYQELSGNEGV